MRTITAFVLTFLASISSVAKELKLLETIPFADGERFVYEARLSKFPFYGKVGELAFETQRLNGRWRFSCEARSKGFLTKLVGVKVNYRFSSTVDTDLGLLTTEKDLDDSKRHVVMRADVSRECRWIRWQSRDLRHPEKLLQSKEREVPYWVTDTLAGIYVCRYSKLDAPIVLPVTDNGELYEIEIAPVGRKTVETEFGKYTALEIDVKVFGKLLRRSGSLRIWLSDDLKRIPLMAQVKGSFGTITFHLVEMKK
ncbi:MAG: DUF3108 domain-containing protein [Acidobacteriota bacterium]|nr:DUF3108 domain-containing protein [Blastocatellia bacterium]MDW8412114.1 DUF3108 domain-containing protein [Acidobacteriota bacterium]